MMLQLFNDLELRLKSALSGMLFKRFGSSEKVQMDFIQGWLPMKRNQDKGIYPLILIQPRTSNSLMGAANAASDGVKLIVCIYNDDPVAGTFDLISTCEKISDNLEKRRLIGNRFRVEKASIAYYDPVQNEHEALIELDFSSPMYEEESDLV